MKRKNCVISVLGFTIALSTLASSSVFATVIPYQLTSVGKIVSCVAKPSGQGMCKGFNVTPIGGEQYSYNNTTQVFLIGENPTITVPFMSNMGHKSICESADSNSIEPMSYCDNPSNDYILVRMSLLYATSNGVISSTSRYNMSMMDGSMTLSAKVSGTQFSPQSS